MCCGAYETRKKGNKLARQQQLHINSSQPLVIKRPSLPGDERRSKLFVNPEEPNYSECEVRNKKVLEQL